MVLSVLKVRTMNTNFFQKMLGSIAERGRALIDRLASRAGTQASSKASETSESRACHQRERGQADPRARAAEFQAGPD